MPNLIAISNSIPPDNKRIISLNGITIHNYCLTREQEWGEVGHLLDKSKPFLPISLSKYNTTTITIKGDSILHYACQFNDPLRTSMKHSTQFPAGLIAADHNERYPIHVGVDSGCNPDVIRFIIRTNPASA